MAKSLLILMLMTTQLLAGSGDSVYLCIGSDGSYRIDAGRDSCTSCDVTCGADCCADSNDSIGQRDGLPCGTHGNNRRFQQAIETLAAEESCDCTHIPIMTSSDQPTRAARASITVDVERLSLLVAQPSSIGLACLPAPPSSLHRWVNSAIPDFALAVISTVIIRC
ncbi:MAG: hypothetical protein U0939_11925 [Pirellulales bacterium]